MVRILCLLAALLACSAQADDAHPIVGVINMLEDLQVQAKEDGEAEASTYQKFTYWCATVDKALNDAITGHKEQIDKLTSTISGDEKDVLTLKRNIAKLEKELTRRNDQATKAKDRRDELKGRYDEEQEELTETIATMEKLVAAMDALESANADTNAGASVLQAKTSVKHAIRLLQILALDEDQRSMLQKFVKEAKAAPGSQKVESQMGNVKELIKSMMADFKKKQVESTKEETEQKNAYNLQKQAQDYAISEAEASKSTKEEILGDRSSDLAEHQGALADEESGLKSESANLENHKADCQTKADEWTERTKHRTGEIEALGQAVKILEKVSGVRNPDTHEIPKHPPYGLTQESEPSGEEDDDDNDEGASFLQLDDPAKKALNVLRMVAKKRKSKSLDRLVNTLGEMVAEKGPFNKMKQMIGKMVVRLMAEQKDEDDHKKWCDMELTKSTDSRDEKEASMEMLDAKIASANAAIAELTEKIAENDQALAELVTYITEETNLRNANSAENAATIKDAKDGKAAVDEAILVLTKFYKSTGQIAKQPYEFVQTHSRIHREKRVGDIDLPESPSTWDAGYTGVTDPEAEGTGVIAILTATGESFATMEADAKAAEESDEKAYQEDMSSSEADKAEKQQDTQMKTNRKTAMSQKLQALSTNKKHLTSELDAVNNYLKDLEPACVSGDSSYEDRKAARMDEVAALRKAQSILEDAFSGGASFLQRRK